LNHCCIYLKKEFNRYELFRIYEIINDFLEYIKKNIDLSYLNNYLKEKYGEKELINLKEKDNYDLTGVYKDIEINSTIFENVCLNKFPNLNNIIENTKKGEEEEIVNFFSEVLNNEGNNLYNKFKDLENNSSQYLKASIDLKTKNNTFTQRLPKPTHHIIVPIEEEIEELPFVKGIYSEQEMIINFCNYLKLNLDNKQNEESTFAFELSNKIIHILCESKDHKMYRNIFNTGNIDIDRNRNIKKEYHAYRDLIIKK